MVPHTPKYSQLKRVCAALTLGGEEYTKIWINLRNASVEKNRVILFKGEQCWCVKRHFATSQVFWQFLMEAGSSSSGTSYLSDKDNSNNMYFQHVRSFSIYRMYIHMMIYQHIQAATFNVLDHTKINTQINFDLNREKYKTTGKMKLKDKVFWMES